MKSKRIYRSNKNKVIAGVFGGLGEYFNVDPVFLRLFWILITIFTGFVPGFIAYLFVIIIIPKNQNK